MAKSILETLRGEVREGELVGLIEKDVGEVKRAFLSVADRVTESLQGIDTEDYHSCIQVNEKENRLIVLSRKSVILTPNPRKIGRTGFLFRKCFNFFVKEFS
jgi:hypothetical protein